MEDKDKAREGGIHPVDGGVDRKNLRRLSIEDLHSQRRRGMIVVSGTVAHSGIWTTQRGQTLSIDL